MESRIYVQNDPKCSDQVALLPECIECTQKYQISVGTLLHMLWSCDKLIRFWDNVCAIISLCLGIYTHPSPRLCLLGNVNIGSQYQSKFCNLGLISAAKQM
jgi:hypothetical protein